jgi:hypothetical protein
MKTIFFKYISMVTFFSAIFITSAGRANEEASKIELGSIVNTRESSWNLIPNEQIQTNINLASATALPKGVHGPETLSGWRIPQSHPLNFEYRNKLGNKIVNFDYTIVYTTGGSYKGVGKYIDRILVIPNNIDVSWGSTFSAATALTHVTNIGTEGAPVAGVEITIKMKIKNSLRTQEFIQKYFIRADGEFVVLE